jgi:arylsulfatase A-like enzyme
LQKPNILLIMADDVGCANPSSYHQGIKGIRAPNIDRLAAEGIRFAGCFAQPSCTAGRSAFLIGQCPVGTGSHTPGLPGDPIGPNSTEPKIAELLKPPGYATGQFGKNHLGDLKEFLPTVCRFDEYWGWLYHLNATEYTADADWRGPKPSTGSLPHDTSSTAGRRAPKTRRWILNVVGPASNASKTTGQPNQNARRRWTTTSAATPSTSSRGRMPRRGTARCAGSVDLEQLR